MPVQPRKFTFTSFQEVEPCFDSSEMNYLVFGKETCPTTGRHHWQSYVEFKNKKTFNQAKRILPEGAHIEAARGDADSNKTYCKKDGDFKEFGAAQVAGQRNDLNLVKARILNGDPLNDLMTDDDCAPIIARHMPFFRALSNNYRTGAGLSSLKARMDGATLRPWQQHYLDNVLAFDPSPRHVHWIWDSTGGTGKSFLCDYLVALHGATVFTHGKVSDIAHAYDFQPVVIFDLSRTQEDKLDGVYMCLENFKNGRFFSPKYESHNKVFAVPHVLVLANFAPDETKLSADRWKIKELTNFF